MQIHELIQGSPEWLAFRATKNTASEASAMMGASKKTLRNELLRMKATGSEKEFSDWVQKNLLDKGHAIEAQARSLAESIIGEELFPCTGSSDEPALEHLAASFDGLTMMGCLAWENKSWNEAKAAQVRDGQVPEEDYWQVVQQLVVSRANRVLYMVTDGTPDRTVHVWVELNPRDEQRLIAGWQQFNEDLANYQHVEAKPDVVAAPVAGLPAITYRMDGLALTSNLAIFRKAAERAVIDSKLPLSTDQDFADREALCKSFAEAETKIKLMREQVIGEVKDIDTFTRELAEIGELIRQARLAGEKQVKDRKESIKLEIRQKAESLLAEHIARCNKQLGGRVILPRIIDNFAGVMKGKRTVATLQDAVDTELARLKIEANEIGARMGENLDLLREKATGVEFLFRDAQELVQKEQETLSLLIDQRIREHREAEEQKERDRLAKQEEDAERLRAQVPAAAVAPATIGMDLAGGPDLHTERGYQARHIEPDLLDTSPIPTGTVMRVEVVDLIALVQAVARGYAPLSVLKVDWEELGKAAELHGRPFHGTTWSKA